MAPPSNAPSAEIASTQVAVPVSMTRAGRCCGRITLHAIAFRIRSMPALLGAGGRIAGGIRDKSLTTVGGGQSVGHPSTNPAMPSGWLPEIKPRTIAPLPIENGFLKVSQAMGTPCSTARSLEHSGNASVIRSVPGRNKPNFVRLFPTSTHNTGSATDFPGSRDGRGQPVADLRIHHLSVPG